MALSPTNRLSAKALDDVFREGVSFRSAGITLRLITGGAGPARVAVSVPVRTAKKATERNRIKRSVLAILQPIMSDLPAGSEAVIIIGRAVAEPEKQREEILTLLVKSGMLKK